MLSEKYFKPPGMKSKYAFLIFILLNLSARSQPSDPSQTPSRVLIINAFDAQAQDFRKNKKELFVKLADSLKSFLAAEIRKDNRTEPVIIHDLFPSILDSAGVIDSLMNAYQANAVIVIKKVDVFFDQTGVEVTKEKDGSKTREASYDICSEVDYIIYEANNEPRHALSRICESFGTRNVMSGLFAAGPDIVANRKQAYVMIGKNAKKLMLSPDNRLFSRSSNIQQQDLPVHSQSSGSNQTPSWILKQHKIKPSDTLLKYSLSFAGQSQMMYDGSKQKTYMNQPMAESGDVAYYNGKYFNSRMRYWHAFEELPEVSYYNEKYFNTRMRYLFSVDELPDPKFHPALGFSSFIKIEADNLTPEYVKVYTRILSTAGMLFQTCGKFTQADEFLTQAMQIRKTVFGKNNPAYLNSLHNIAVLRKDMGWYDEADSLFNYLQPIFKELYTINSSEYVLILNNKAMLLAELGRTKEAMRLLNEALETGSTVLSNAYFDYERILTNRALLKQELGDLDNAEKDYLQVLENMEKKGFEDHPDYNNVMMYYGSLRVQKNDADLPSFLSKTTEKIRKRYKEDHPLTAKANSNTADYYLNNKLYAEARNIYRKVITIQGKVLGEKHKDYLNTLMKLGVCEWHLQENGNATSHFSKAIVGYQLILNKLFRSMSEPEKSSFWKTLKPAIDTYLAYVLEAGKANPTLLKDAYELQLKTKGLLINSTKQTRNIILNSGDSVLNKLYNEWLYLKTKLSTYYSSPLEDLKQDKIDLVEIENRANDIEKELARKSSRFAMEYSPISISFEDVRAKLNKDEIAVEIIRVFHFYGNKKGESEYIALVIKKDSTQPILVRIGNAIDIEQNYLSQYKKNIKAKGADTQSYTIFWQPLESTIGNCSTIYVSLDGVYNSINLNTLQRNDGKFMLDSYNIILVNSTRSISSGLHSMVKLSGQETEALLLGSPNYGNDEVIPPLPETKEEIQQIDTLLLRDHIRSKILIEENATEQNIKSTKQPAILHVATHGFFNENVDLSKKMNMGVQVSFAKDNVLLRSGLFFNGAASIFNNDPILDASNNGVLYAYEAMNLNLQGTDLVVLSACETGIGEIMNGEGVFGLSRSFQVAGADKILMSLWKVDDRVTKELMITFYRNWLRVNDPQQAFLQAQKTIKEKYPQPFYWGAFVLLN